ncbi:MAG: DUF1992 domain-containing protein [Desulfamplus sp.]|nr:DUF1992 domain-containing protein [Desulfamplus sp.]
MIPGFETLVEERILKAQKNGELDNLPGKGKPLNLDDMSIPEDFRTAYRILKNSGFVPPEVEIRKQIKQLETLLHTLDEQDSLNSNAVSKTDIPTGKTDFQTGKANIETGKSDVQMTKSDIQKKLNFLMVKLNTNRGNSASPAVFPETYRKTLLRKISTGQ